MTSPRCEQTTYRQLLGKGDTLHDFCDRDRIRDKLNYGIEKKFISNDINTTEAANIICSKVESLLDVDTCGIQTYDENNLLKIFYGDKSLIDYDETIRINYSELDKHIAFTGKQHLEYQIPYIEVSSFIEKINAISSANYVMDYTYLSPFLCGFGINTIGKAYDRTTTNEGDKCNKKASMIPQSVLKKDEGELFFFDEIYTTTDDMTLKWLWNGKEGIIDIRKMIEVKSTALLENLTTAILAFYQANQITPTPLLYKSNDIIKYCYDLDITQFSSNINDYLLALTDLKRIGDLLQVKLAALLGYTFVSNDRMAILLSTVGYNNLSIRSSKVPSSDERSDRIIALYNFDDTIMGEKLEAYYQDALKNYYRYITEYFNNIKLFIENITFTPDYVYQLCEQILTIIRTNIPLDPSITKEMTIESTTGRAPRHYNPKWLNRNVIIYRGLFKYIEFIKVILTFLNFIKSTDFTNFKNNIETIYTDEQKTAKEKLDIVRKLFEKNTIPHPNTLLKLVTNDEIQLSLTNLITFVNTISGFINDINEVTTTMEMDLPMPLFGEPIEYYKKSIVKLFKELKPSQLTVNIGGNYYQIGISANPEKIIESILDLETYFTEFIKLYSPPQQGGRRKKSIKSNKIKRGGQSIIESSIFPDNIIDQTLGKLVVAIYKAESQGQKDIAQNLFVSYMQLQLLTQQFNFNLPIVGEVTIPTVVTTTNQKLTTMIQKPIIPISATISTPAAAAAGGNKKTKMQKEVKAKKKPTTDKKKSK